MWKYLGLIDVPELEDFVYRGTYTEGKLERLGHALEAFPYLSPTQRRRILDFAPYALICLGTDRTSIELADSARKEQDGLAACSKVNELLNNLWGRPG